MYARRPIPANDHEQIRTTRRIIEAIREDDNGGWDIGHRMVSGPPKRMK